MHTNKTKRELIDIFIFLFNKQLKFQIFSDLNYTQNLHKNLIELFYFFLNFSNKNID